MTAIAAAERPAHQALIRRLRMESLEAVDGLPDGLGFRFPAAEYEAVARFVSGERPCCPFLRPPWRSSRLGDR